MAAVPQIREALLHEHERGERAGLEGLQRIGLVDVVDLAVLHGALGAVHQDVDAAEVLGAAGHHVSDLLDVGHVAGHGQHLAAERGHLGLQLLELLQAPGAGAHPRAVLGQHLRHAAAHAGAGPRHDGDASLELSHDAAPLSSLWSIP